MSLGNNPVPNVAPSQPGPEIVAEVTVSAASAIVASKEDPYRVLVADSAKHPRPVLPGGKVEAKDLQADGGSPGLTCVLREVLEEIGTSLLTPRYVGKATDPDRDIRLVPPSKLAGAVVTPPLPENLPSQGKVKAHYGCPDYLFVGQVDEKALTATEELKGLRFVDIRTLGPGDVSAGHDVIVLTYRKMLEHGATQMEAGALRNFAVERDRFVAR